MNETFIPINVMKKNTYPKKFIDIITFDTSRNVFAVDESSYLWSWGYNPSGNLGNTSGNQSYSSPTSVYAGGKTWRKIVTNGIANNSASVSGLADNLSGIWAWGAINGQAQPILVPNTSSIWFIDICSVGARSFAALDSSSYLWTWGDNTNGVLGDGTTTFRSSPVSVSGGPWKPFSYINNNVRNQNFCFLDASGYAYAWGVNTYGQLGDGTVTAKSSPVSVLGGKQWIQLFSTQDNVFAIDTSSYLWAWGANNQGQLGLVNSVASRSSPISITNIPFTKIVANNVTGSGNGWVGVDTSSYIWGCGLINPGFGLSNPNIQKCIPSQILPDTLHVAYNGNTIYGFSALLPNNHIISWGNNTGYVLGYGAYGATGAAASNPYSVNISNRFVKYGCADGASIALDQSGYIWTWGGSSIGNLAGIYNNNPIAAPTRMGWNVSSRIDDVLGRNT
jgi:alpha-tubulin suppressor-like RCC1 family protein